MPFDYPLKGQRSLLDRTVDGVTSATAAGNPNSSAQDHLSVPAEG